MFKLTRQEQALIIFILLSMVIGAAVKYYRHSRLQPGSNPIAAPARMEMRASPQPQAANEEER